MTVVAKQKKPETKKNPETYACAFLQQLLEKPVSVQFVLSYFRLLPGNILAAQAIESSRKFQVFFQPRTVEQVFDAETGDLVTEIQISAYENYDRMHRLADLWMAEGLKAFYLTVATYQGSLYVLGASAPKTK